MNKHDRVAMLRWIDAIERRQRRLHVRFVDLFTIADVGAPGGPFAEFQRVINDAARGNFLAYAYAAGLSLRCYRCAARGVANPEPATATLADGLRGRT